jgi:serine/threonine protein kinase
MKHYQGTLSQIKIPLPDQVLLKYGRQLEKALRHMHSCGYCHLDVKPSNVFIFESSCFLGDYGAARPIGSEVMEVTRSYYPSDFPIEAQTQTDFLLLSKTLLEMYGQIESPVKPMTSEEIREAIENVNINHIRSFLQSLCKR